MHVPAPAVVLGHRCQIFRGENLSGVNYFFWSTTIISPDRPGDLIVAEQRIALNGNTLVCGCLHEGVLRQWDLENGQLLREEPSSAAATRFNTLAFGGDSALYQNDPEDTVKSYSFQTGQPIGETLDTRDVTALAVQEEMAVTGSWDGSVQV